jgi:hypothetical protein
MHICHSLGYTDLSDILSFAREENKLPSSHQIALHQTRRCVTVHPKMVVDCDSLSRL